LLLSLETYFGNTSSGSILSKNKKK